MSREIEEYARRREQQMALLAARQGIVYILLAAIDFFMARKNYIEGDTVFVVIFSILTVIFTILAIGNHVVLHYYDALERKRNELLGKK